MTVKLLLNPAAEAKRCVHPATGVAFMIRPVNPDKFSKIRKASLGSNGELDLVKWGGNFAVEAIADWQQPDPSDPELPCIDAECNDANKALFGRNQAINIMPWIIDQATSLDHYRVEEETAAKNA